MQSCDVLIVGGGPAGSACAWGLRDSRLDVAVLDKQAFPRDKVCGGWITPEVLARLEIDPAEYGRERMLQPITGFRIGLIGGASIETSYGKTVSYGIRRREFDYFLLGRSGGRILPPAALTSLERRQDGWIANSGIRCRLIVGAGGHFCPVARFTGAKAGGEAPVVAQETEFEMRDDQSANCMVRGDTPELYFCPDMKGYGWCFRKGNILNVGLGRADQHDLPAHVAEFLRFLRVTGRICFDLPSLHGHAYLLSGASPRKTAGDHLLLIGDAAGVAFPQSGEGILPAIESGLQAAKSIATAESQFEETYLESNSNFPATKPAWVAVSNYLPWKTVGFIARYLLGQPWFARGIVLDQWFLHQGSRGFSS